MTQAGYALSNNANVALAAATAKTVMLLITPANIGLQLKRFTVSLNSVTPTEAPGLIEIVRSSLAGAGTTTSATANIVQNYGRAITHSFTAGENYTAEPTTLTLVRKFLLSPVSSTFAYDYPLGTEPDIGASSGLGIRCTFAAAANIMASMEFERI